MLIQEYNHSQHIIVNRQCACETFEMKNKWSVRPSLDEYREQMICLLVTASMFPIKSTIARKMKLDFFWDYVKRPTNVGLSKDEQKEGKNRSVQ